MKLNVWRSLLIVVWVVLVAYATISNFPTDEKVHDRFYEVISKNRINRLPSPGDGLDENLPRRDAVYAAYKVFSRDIKELRKDQVKVVILGFLFAVCVPLLCWWCFRRSTAKTGQ